SGRGDCGTGDCGAGVGRESESLAVEAQLDQHAALPAQLDGLHGPDLNAVYLDAVAALESAAVGQQQGDVHAAAEDGRAEHPEEAPEEDCGRDDREETDGDEIAFAVVHGVLFTAQEVASSTRLRRTDRRTTRSSLRRSSSGFWTARRRRS